MRREKGFSAVEGIIVVVVLALIGAGAWFVYQRSSDNSSNDTQTTIETVNEAARDEPIETVTDLENATSELDSINLDELDTTELEAIENDLL